MGEWTVIFLMLGLVGSLAVMALACWLTSISTALAGYLRQEPKRAIGVAAGGFSAFALTVSIVVYVWGRFIG